jgi:hypothetical protein
MKAERMVRKQIYLTVSQNTRLRRAAKQLRRSEAELLREAIERQLAETGPGAPDFCNDPLFGLVGVGESAEGSLSEQVDEILYGKDNR